MQMERKDFEIMAPVGSYESLQAAIDAGADAIYFGIEGLNMRARSSANFSIDDLHHIAALCREKGLKSYLTVNTIIYDNDIETMHHIVDAAREAGISAIIASDVAAMTYARSIGVEVHLSTQLNISNTEALRFYSQFADVVVLARELNLEQVSQIHRAIEEQHIIGPAGNPVRIEMFCHGALWHGRVGEMLSKSTRDEPFGKSRFLHADMPSFISCDRPRNRRRTHRRESLHHVTQRPEDYTLS